ncbi:hypothetical protein Mapa_001641 [Marchantia paleacea]|nr:hypothetical protein Mapa_001641 [Marchantia paleacea]
MRELIITHTYLIDSRHLANFINQLPSCASISWETATYIGKMIKRESIFRPFVLQPFQL